VTMKIPATVVTGFLGAGKTSLIRHLLERSGGRRLALLINEFGNLGIDRGIIGGCGIPTCREEDVIELANGCICCTVADDFLPAMHAILARSPAPEHIIIETSGLALPLAAPGKWHAVSDRPRSKFDQRVWSPPRSMLIPSEPGEASPGASAVLPCVRARSFELRFSLRMPKMILAALQSTL
jgi:hypothetical protein